MPHTEPRRHVHHPHGTAPSVLDDLGEELTGIAAPVSICMAIVVLLVRILNPNGESNSSTVFIASVAYRESEQVCRPRRC